MSRSTAARQRRAWRAGVLVLAILAAPAGSVRAQEAHLAELAQLLALEDRREYDGLTLERTAQHPDSLVRRRAAAAMGRIGDRAATPLLVRLLEDADSLVRAEAAFALGELGDPAAAGDLVRVLESANPANAGAVATEVVTALAKIGGPTAERALERVLDRHAAEAPSNDRAAASALLEAWRLPDTSAVAGRLEAYVRRSRGEWRRNATYAAVRLRLAAAVPALLEASRDEDALTRSYAARGLTAQLAERGGVGREGALAPLSTLLSDDDAQVRINALRALASYRDSTLSARVAARLLDRDPNVAIEAATTLGALGGARAADALAERLTAAGSFGLRRAALLALARVEAPRALEAVRPWREDGDWRLRMAAAEVVAAAGTPAAFARLAELSADPDARVAGVALGAWLEVAPEGDSALLATARAQLDHADPVVRASAIGALARVRDVRWLDDLLAAYRRAARDPVNDARLAAVDALGEIARASPSTRGEIASRFFAMAPRSEDYLVRRAVARAFGREAHEHHWGGIHPIATGRSAEDYRDLIRRYVVRTAPVSTRVTVETERGSLVIELFGAEAPLTVDNFLRLVDRGFYDNGRWHRVVPNFVLQDGDPRGDGAGGPGTAIRDEINRRRYQRGTVGMALAGPDTGGSQFFICHSPQPHLDGGYTVFGAVVSGWDVLDRIVQGDRIRRMFRVR